MNRIFVVVPASDSAAANTAIKQSVDVKGGDKTFTVPLSPSGKAPATHYCCCTLLTPQNYTSVKSLISAYPNAEVIDCLEKDASNGKSRVIGKGLKFVVADPNKKK
jgi:hypothetical protein